MTTSGATDIRPFVGRDEAAVRRLLGDSQLPVDDLDETRLQTFLTAHRNGLVIGVVGLEVHGRHGLLRSLAVAPTERGQGLGQALTAAVEARARELGVDRLFLLTVTADRFFPRFGYERIERSDVPTEIAATTEFATLCPAAAVCFERTLGTS